MDPRARTAFLWLLLAQSAHSIEEYLFRLYDVLAPARFVSSLLSDDPARGFAIANVLLVLFGVACYLVSIRPGLPSARGLAWFWSLLELGNGASHSVLAAAQQGYFPGVATAPLLIGLSGYLISLLMKQADNPSRG
jgi:hypothetical protein